MAPHIEGLQKLKESGAVVEMLDDAPELLPEAAYFYKAFKDLSTSRSRGDAGFQPITIVEIESYCRLIEERDPAYFMDFIKELDIIFISFYE